MSGKLTDADRERLVQIVTDELLHLPVKGRVLELAARQVVFALEQAGALAERDAP